MTCLLDGNPSSRDAYEGPEQGRPDMRHSSVYFRSRRLPSLRLHPQVNAPAQKMQPQPPDQENQDMSTYAGGFG